MPARAVYRVAAAFLLLVATSVVVIVVGAGSASADTQWHCGSYCDGCNRINAPDTPNDGCPDGNWFVRTPTIATPNCWSQGNWAVLGSCENLSITYVNAGYVCSGCDHINIYWGRNYSGAWACESRLDEWDKGSGGVFVHFDHGAGKSGYGQTVFNNAASIKWVGSC